MKIKTAVLFILVLSTSAFQTPVPVTDEGHHHVKFENKYVRIYDVVVAPGDETLYHVHSNDYVYVVIGNATLKAQTPGSEQTDLILKDGEVRFSKAPITHRVLNPSSSPFHCLAVEILSSSDIKQEVAPSQVVPGRSVILENDKVRVTRLVLEPGQSTGMHTHKLMRVGIVLTASKVADDSPGQPQQIKESQPGVYNWSAEQRTHSVKNIGTTRYESIDIEWK